MVMADSLRVKLKRKTNTSLKATRKVKLTKKVQNAIQNELAFHICSPCSPLSTMMTSADHIIKYTPPNIYELTNKVLNAITMVTSADQIIKSAK